MAAVMAAVAETDEQHRRDIMENIVREGDTGFISGIITPIRGVGFPRIDPGSSFELVPPGQDMVLSAGVVHLADGRGRMSHFYTPSEAVITGPAFCAWTPEDALGRGGIHGLIERQVISNRSEKRVKLMVMGILIAVILAITKDNVVGFVGSFAVVMLFLAPMFARKKVTVLPEDIIYERHAVSFPGAVRKRGGSSGGAEGQVCPAGFGCGGGRD